MAAEIKRSIVMRGIKNFVALGVGMAFTGALVLTGSDAQAVTLVNHNTSVTVANVGANPGHTITAWTVDSVNHNANTSYYYRIGPGGTAFNFDTLNFVSSSTSTTVANTKLTTTYQDAGANFQIVTKYTITGGANSSGASDIAVQIAVNLLNPALALNFNVYEVGDLDLSNSAGDDTDSVSVANGKQVAASDAQTNFLEGSQFSFISGGQTLTAVPTHFTTGTLAGVNGQLGGNLNDNPAAGPGNEAYGLQYSFALGGDPSGTGPSALISQDKNLGSTAIGLVPEPATTMLSFLGLAALGGTLIGRRNRKAVVAVAAVAVGIGAIVTTSSNTMAAAGEGYSRADNFSDFDTNAPGTTNGTFNPSPNLPGVFYLDRNNGGGGDHLQDLTQQWYWIKVGGGPITRLDLLGTSFSGAPAGNTDGTGSDLNVYYGNSQVDVSVSYSLTGGAANSYKTELTRAVTVTNKTGVAQAVKLYSFTDLDLGQIDTGPGAGLHGRTWSVEPGSTEAANLASAMQIRQSESTAGGVISDSLTTYTPSAQGTTATHYQIGDAATLRTALETNTLAGSSFNDTTTGAADQAYGFEYDLSLSASGAGISRLVSEDLLVTPEPASIALLGIGAALIGMPRRKSKRD